MAVRSRRFFGPTALNNASGLVVLYTVPALRTAVVRELTATYGGGVAGELAVTINGNTWLLKQGLNRESFDLVPESVWNPGDIIRATASSAGFWLLTASGALLDGPPL